LRDHLAQRCIGHLHTLDANGPAARIATASRPAEGALVFTTRMILTEQSKDPPASADWD